MLPESERVPLPFLVRPPLPVTAPERASVPPERMFSPRLELPVRTFPVNEGLMLVPEVMRVSPRRVMLPVKFVFAALMDNAPPPASEGSPMPERVKSLTTADVKLLRTSEPFPVMEVVVLAPRFWLLFIQTWPWLTVSMPW